MCSNRRRLTTDKITTVHKFEKLLDAFPQAVFKGMACQIQMNYCYRNEKCTLDIMYTSIMFLKILSLSVLCLRNRHSVLLHV